MTIAITHKFQSLKGDGTDSTLLRPSNWNDSHKITLATGVLLGRQTAGVGDAEEIPCSAAAAQVLAAADIAAILAVLGVSAPTTGDARLTLKTAPTSGWVMLDDGTIGNATSGAGNRAHADTQALFTLLYNAPFTDASAPVTTTAGTATTRAAQGTAAAAYAAGCRVALPKQLGRTFIAAGAAGTGLTARTLGTTGGEETHALVAGEIPTITSSGSMSGTMTGSTSSVATGSSGSSTGGGGFACVGAVSFSAASVSVSGTVTGSVTSTGTGGASPAHNNMQPWAAWNVMVKL
ncbi:hypothetical protein IVA80_15245 [Bradyrhizobium sp. 139]|uniref:hypothetical protein n=1 Tax=Bradyrhizobium sp. 139 TaxID=2782616 RepID=UPI001FF9E37C|nr:hypothetical protein [Bradyrhizobium sp. 139]MCK1742179.1 hypothetical protein [Bradyrhizobium sp. 139]